MPVTRIISGGQTGADRAGLDVAIRLELPHGGWCPKGRRAEDGPVPARYQLRESPAVNYQDRMRRNVADADATVVFTLGTPGPGSRLTIATAERSGKPVLHVDLSRLDESEASRAVRAWLARHHSVATLNVAGSRESGSPGIGAVVVRVLHAAVAEGD